MKRTIIPLHRVGTSTEEMSDAALVAACAVGDQAALGVLFDRHHLNAYRFLSRLAGPNEVDADDLVQATFIEVFRAAKKFRGRSAVRTWILGIAANVVRHHVRSQARRRAMLRALASRPLPPSDGIGPDRIAERRELVLRLKEALESLPHDLRVAFVMCDLEEVPGVEAARALGIKDGTLWRRLYEARRALRAALGEAST